MKSAFARNTLCYPRKLLLPRVFGQFLIEWHSGLHWFRFNAFSDEKPHDSVSTNQMTEAKTIDITPDNKTSQCFLQFRQLALCLLHSHWLRIVYYRSLCKLFICLRGRERIKICAIWLFIIRVDRGRKASSKYGKNFPLRFVTTAD